MKAVLGFYVLAIALLQISHQVQSAPSEVADLLKDNDNKTVIIRPDTTTSSPAATTISPSVRDLANDTAVNSSPPTHTESGLVETVTPGQQKSPASPPPPPPLISSSQKIKENTATPIDNITTINTTSTPPNVTIISNSISSASPSTFINETNKIIENNSTSIINETKTKIQEINQTKIEIETEKPANLSTDPIKTNTSTNVIVTTVESVTKKNELTHLAKENQTKPIIVFNVTETPVTQSTPIQINQTKESVTSNSETTKISPHPNDISISTTSQELVAHPAEAVESSADDQAVIIPGGLNHSGEAQRLEQDEKSAALNKHEKHDHPASGGFLEPGMTAAIMASIFVGVAIFGYIGLILWRKMLERRYGTREMLVNEDDFNDVNYMSNFEL